MNFQSIGNGSFWPNEDDAEPNPRQAALATLDDLTGKTLQALQKIIGSYVNLRADAELTALQDCVSELLRGASQCRRENKRYEISENENTDLN